MKFINYFGGKGFEVAVCDQEEDVGLRSFAYPGALEDRWVHGASILVRKGGCQPWVGHFSAGKESPNAVDLCCDHPDGKHIVVLAKGSGYVVSACDPSDWSELAVRPIMGYCAIHARKVLVLFDYTKLIGFLSDGTVWRTGSLSWDGLRNVRATDSAIVGEGWDAATGSFVGFEVDVRTGESSGGAAPPEL
ncbi:hypothetical protein [Alkalilimnicola ehrlichii]|uniref:hypothetical protein n=1 Tax=Alkalilimnicola ehrlichii TaxID=351052 RepID=UPI000E2E5BA7|nr:hypothetical protein [Alkalilimnicola ehrlichii]